MLRGCMIPVGKVKMKVLAAHSAGITSEVLLERNKHDLEELLDNVRNTMSLVQNELINEALKIPLLPEEERRYPSLLTAPIAFANRST